MLLSNISQKRVMAFFFFFFYYHLLVGVTGLEADSPASRCYILTPVSMSELPTLEVRG